MEVMGDYATSLVRDILSIGNKKGKKRVCATDLLDNDTKRRCSARSGAKAYCPLTCAHCFQTFSQHTTLRRHVNTKHSGGGATFECSMCAKKFNRKDVRDRHLHNHTRERHITCKHCGLQFRKDYLRDHLKGDRNYRCKAAYAVDAMGSPHASEEASSNVREEDVAREGMPQDAERAPNNVGERPLSLVTSVSSSSSMSVVRKSVSGPQSSMSTVATSDYSTPPRRSEDRPSYELNSTTPLLVPDSPEPLIIPYADDFVQESILEDEHDLEEYRQLLHDIQDRAHARGEKPSSVEKQVRKRLSTRAKQSRRVSWTVLGQTCGICDLRFANPYNRGNVLHHLKQHVVDSPEPRHTCVHCGICFVFKNDLRRHLKGRPPGSSAGCELGAEVDDWSHVMREHIIQDLRPWERYQICDLVYRLMNNSNAFHKIKAADSSRTAKIPRCSWPGPAVASSGNHNPPADSPQANMYRPVRPPLTTLGSTKSYNSQRESVLSCPYNTDYGTTYDTHSLVASLKQMTLQSQDSQRSNGFQRSRHYQGSSSCILHGKRQGEPYRTHNDICTYCRKNGLWVESTMDHLHNVKTLLQASVDPSTCPGWPTRESPLAAAVRCGHIEVAKLLVSHGARLHRYPAEARTFVQYFCQHVTSDDSDFSAFLLDNGLDPNATSEGGSLLTAVASSTQGSSDLARMLLEYGADPNGGDNEYSSESVPLGFACSAGSYELVKVLLEYGANTNMRNPGPGLSLHICCVRGHDSVIRLILEEKGTPATTADVCSTMLAAACISGHEKVVQTLLEYGANPRAVNDRVFEDMASLEPELRWKIKQLLLAAYTQSR